MSAHVAVQTVFLTLSRYDSVLATNFMLQFQLEDGCTLERAIVLLNRHWRDVLGQQPRNTMEARSFLVDACSLPEWVSLFERGVIPELLNHASVR